MKYRQRMMIIIIIIITMWMTTADRDYTDCMFLTNSVDDSRDRIEIESEKN